MDRVRFGRALGYGTRHAAKSLLKAVEAASAPNPTASVGAARTGSRAARPAEQVAQRVVQTRRTVASTKKHAGALGRSVWSPLAKFSSVLWLQVTGTFFTLIAAFLSQGLWKERAAVKMSVHSAEAGKFYLHLVAFLVFAYFAVSNFVRASRRERR
jgi:hypothetical protein